ncbi:hypothetical protein [Pyrococcus kukulkanii]|uniref:hypothetical protein n=1 Tax=Pyrococcus kukulkanii TaxID=1609559 RepID=UPI003566B2B9
MGLWEELFGDKKTKYDELIATLILYIEYIPPEDRKKFLADLIRKEGSSAFLTRATCRRSKRKTVVTKLGSMKVTVSIRRCETLTEYVVKVSHPLTYDREVTYIIPEWSVVRDVMSWDDYRECILEVSKEVKFIISEVRKSVESIKIDYLASDSATRILSNRYGKKSMSRLIGRKLRRGDFSISIDRDTLPAVKSAAKNIARGLGLSWVTLTAIDKRFKVLVFTETRYDESECKVVAGDVGYFIQWTPRGYRLVKVDNDYGFGLTLDTYVKDVVHDPYARVVKVHLPYYILAVLDSEQDDGYTQATKLESSMVKITGDFMWSGDVLGEEGYSWAIYVVPKKRTVVSAGTSKIVLKPNIHYALVVFPPQ